MKLRQFTVFLLCAILLSGFSPITQASEPDIAVSYTYINPLYSGIISEEELKTSPTSHRVLFADPEYLTTVEEAALVLREGMKNRSESISVSMKTDSYDGNKESIKALMRQISDLALTHTGNPVEGDYLMWQYGGWDGNASGSTDGTAYYWTFTYTVTYYTTAQQEEEMDTAIASLLDQLNPEEKTEYQKIRSIYDYICENVSYDRDHLDDLSYKRQFTAYAALFDKTAVCQGYALLFYRLALEMGLDARLIPGVSNGQNHGWNIVKIDDLYYNGDTTWDSGKTEYQYFLKCNGNFQGHTRDEEYETADFNSAYPMSPADYVPSAADLCIHSYSLDITKEATCTEEGTMIATCSHCGNTYTQSIQPQNHTYDSTISQPTCTEDGSTVYTCTICGSSYSETISATGHSWDEGTVIQEPSRYEEGLLEYHCTACTATKTTAIPALGIPEVQGVTRLSGKDRYKTAFLAADMLKKQLGVDQFSCAVIASGTNFADALSGSYLACQKSAPILLVSSSTVFDVAAYLEENLVSGSTVYILGGTAAVPAALDTALDGFAIRRLYGPNRYDTNLKILEEAGVGEEDILVCTGLSFADSLSASALNRPILLVNKTLTDTQKEFLADLDENDIYIIGGTGAVSAGIANALSGYGSGNVSRISGSNRYATSIRVAETFFFDAPDNIVLAYGHNFPDGLCGGVLAYSMNAPLILTRDSEVDAAADYAYNTGITTGAVLGGSKLISDDAVKTIFQMSSSDPIQKP